MHLFISHATSDRAVAESVKLHLEEIPGLRCALLAEDIPPGDDWEVGIRKAARECDAIACLVTPEYVKRPWFYAEWAVFWFQEEKTWYLLMLDASLEDVFEVMRRRQSAVLNDRRSVEGLLGALAGDDLPTRPLELLAADMVGSVARARDRALRAHAEADLARLATRLRSGEDNISMALVQRLLEAGHRDDIIRVAKDPASNSPTKRRQLAVCLVALGDAEAAGLFDQLIFNNAERRTVGTAALERLAQRPDPGAEALVMKIYGAVPHPQRKNLRDRAADLGVDVAWPDIDASP